MFELRIFALKSFELIEKPGPNRRQFLETWAELVGKVPEEFASGY